MCNYTLLLSQVIVGCEGSTVTVWDIDTGNKVLHFPRCHGNTEITCLQLDSSGRRLITGSRYGDVKVWNYHTGECLKTLHHAHKTEVTGAVSITDIITNNTAYLSLCSCRYITMQPLPS